VTAERLRCAEIEHGDAIAIAGEFEAMNLSWEVSCRPAGKRDGMAEPERL
jgi:hypothetical protein